eukprot:TRINITY_DN1155_c1_g1_i4.p1 TRINITY_DN1155_c1_g1~~TRINITY_DN1155_c1_g1_i4.p1  ORF type:complete len:468 (-),score=92.51 TRINITY_DN1155_c1_g1_i4:625-2028(-)
MAHTRPSSAPLTRSRTTLSPPNAFANPFGSVAQTTSKRYASQSALRKQLRSMEERSIRAAQLIDENKEKILNSTDEISTSQSASEMIAQLREQSLKVMADYMQTQAVESKETKKHVDMADMERVYQSKINTLQAEVAALRHDAEASQKEVDMIKSEYDAQRHIVDMLRLKLAKMSEREIENQRKLKVFSKMEPIFRKLAERFDFASPEDVIERLENLERYQLESYTQLLEAQEQRNMMERKLDQSVKEKDESYRMRLVELNQALEKSERRYSELQGQVSKLQSGLHRADETQDKYLTLSFTILDIYNRWIKSEIALQAKTRASHEVQVIDNPDLSDPLQLLNAMQNILSFASNSLACERLREISGISNSLWLTFFSDDMSIKSKPKEIFVRVYKELEDKDATIRKLKTQVTASQRTIKELEAQVEAFSKDKRRLEEEIDQRGRLLRSLATRSSQPTRANTPNEMRGN